MGLIANTTLNSSRNLQYTGGNTAGLTSMWFLEGVYTFYLSGFDQKYGWPSSLGTFKPPIKAGGLSSVGTMRGDGSLAAQLQIAKDMNAALAGSGDLQAALSLIVTLSASIAGSGALSANLASVINMAANLAGQGDVLAGLGLLINLFSDLSGSGDIEADLKGILSMAANITSQGDALTTANVGAAVWAAIAASNNTTGSMGEKLNDAGAAGNPWAALLSANNTPETFGALVQTVNSLVDELHKIQGLDAANPMTVTQTNRTAGDINLDITGDGTTTTTVTRND